MYYLRKEPYERILPELICEDGTVFPERTITTADVAIYKRTRYYFDVLTFNGIGVNPIGFKLYTYKTLKNILRLRQEAYDYCGEWFDVYDENGKVELDEVGEIDDGEQ